MVTELQKRTILAMVRVFETGSPRGDYSAVTLAPGDRGGLSYGHSQASLASGTLGRLLRAYAKSPGARLGRDLAPFLPRIQPQSRGAPDSIGADKDFHALLMRAGRDPVMRTMQDELFEHAYWRPAARAAARAGLGSPLAHAVIYDSIVHGSFARLRNRTMVRHGAPAALGERSWIAAYVAERHAWLERHGNALLRRTTYRMRALRLLMDQGRWDLELPLTVHGVTLTRDVLPSPEGASGQGGRGQAGRGQGGREQGDRGTESGAAQTRPVRLLRPRTPPMTGADVARTATALRRGGINAPQGSAYTQELVQAVMVFQRRAGLAVDGLVGPATRRALGLQPRGASLNSAA